MKIKVLIIEEVKQNHVIVLIVDVLVLSYLLNKREVNGLVNG